VYLSDKIVPISQIPSWQRGLLRAPVASPMPNVLSLDHAQGFGELASPSLHPKPCIIWWQINHQLKERSCSLNNPMTTSWRAKSVFLPFANLNQPSADWMCASVSALDLDHRFASGGRPRCDLGCGYEKTLNA